MIRRASVIVIAAALACNRGGTPRNDGIELILSDVVNATGDTVFDRSVQTAALIALRQSTYVHIYPQSRLLAMYALMRIGRPDTALTFDLAQEVAERAGVRWVLGLNLSRRDDLYVVEARLTDVGTKGRAVVRIANTPVPRTAVLAVVDETLREVRRTIGESRRELSARSGRLPFVTTESLEALHSYADGSAAWAQGDYERARELWERAVDLDTGFAMALGALGSWHYYTHNRDLGEHYFQAAFAHENRLTERELLDLRIRRAGHRGNLDSAIALQRRMADEFPATDSWYDLGTDLMRAGRENEAIAAFERTLAIDSLYTRAWINLATANNIVGRQNQAIESYRRAERVDATALYHGNINHEFGIALVLAGRLADADSAYRRMAAAPTIEDRALGFRSLGYLALWRGNLVAAADYFRLAGDATVQMHSALSEARNRLLLANVYRAENRTAEANHEVDRVLALATAPTIEPAFLGVLAYQCAQLDRRRDADSAAHLARRKARADNPVDQASVAFADAATFLARHRPDSALDAARRSARLPWPILRSMVTAEAFRGTNQLDSARAALREMLSTSGFGSEGETDWLHAPLVLGDLLVAAGDTAGAIQRYRGLIDQWRDAPAESPDLVAARARLKALAAAGR